MTDTALTPAETDNLQTIAGIMIPASEEFRVPGANDPAIFADIVRSIGRDFSDVRAALAAIAAIAGGNLTGLNETRREQIAETFRDRNPALATTLGRVVLQCYYRDDRVVRSLGLEPRPPFPKGHTLEQGDWSLLDPVRTRPKMWREAP